MNSKVSIITPCYNSAKYIGEMIKSIINQTYTNWELLITDDCSSDNSRDIINAYAEKDPRIKLFKLDKNSGAGVARNNSIKAAKGRYIAFCDSDDRWHPKKLEKQLKFMTDNNYYFSFTACDLHKEDGSYFGHQSVPKKVTYRSLLRNCAVPSSTAVYDCSRIGKMLMPSIRKRQDWCLWLDIVRETKQGFGLNETLMYYLVRTNSISSKKSTLIKYNFRVYNQHLKYSKVISFCLLFCYFLPNYLVKRFLIRFSKNHSNNN